MSLDQFSCPGMRVRAGSESVLRKFRQAPLFEPVAGFYSQDLREALRETWSGRLRPMKPRAPPQLLSEGSSESTCVTENRSELSDSQASKISLQRMSSDVLLPYRIATCSVPEPIRARAILSVGDAINGWSTCSIGAMPVPPTSIPTRLGRPSSARAMAASRPDSAKPRGGACIVRNSIASLSTKLSR